MPVPSDFITLYQHPIDSYSTKYNNSLRAGRNLNNRRCFLTDMMNDLLGIPREKRIAMRDPLAVLLNIHYENDGTGTLRDDLYWIYLITVSAFCGTFLYIKQN